MVPLIDLFNRNNTTYNDHKNDNNILKLTAIPQILSLLIISLFTAFGVNAKDLFLKTNTPQNITICAQLADSGDSLAQNTLGEIYYQDALIHPGYHTKARFLFEKAAAQGLAVAQYNLGAIYRDEFNNFPIALAWLVLPSLFAQAS